MAGRYSFDDTLRFHADPELNSYESPPDRMLYGYLHMAEYCRHALLYRGGPIRELPNGPPSLREEIAAFPVQTWLSHSSLDRYVHHPLSGVDGVVVLKAGDVAYAAYPRMRPFDKHVLWSVSKVFTGTLIAILEEQGKLDVSRPIEKYLPELAGSGWDGVVVRDILDMASGIDAREWEEEAEQPGHPLYEFEASLGFIRERTEDTNRSTHAFVTQLANRVPPGTRYEYSSINTFMLGWLAERVGGRALNELLTEEIWMPMGAEADGLISISDSGANGADGGISCTLTDLARFGLLFTPAGRAGQRRPIISDDYLTKIQRTGRRGVFLAGDTFAAQEIWKDDPSLCNCWHWDLVWGDGDMYKSGWRGQGLYVSPGRDVVIAFFGCPAAPGTSNDMFRVVRQIATTL
jgi:CubicO group peptidase (beta-lactamase class C family)